MVEARCRLAVPAGLPPKSSASVGERGIVCADDGCDDDAELVPVKLEAGGAGVAEAVGSGPGIA